MYVKPNISAPGSDIRSSLRGSDTEYDTLSGTSMAGPHVAGLVALVIAILPQAITALSGDDALELVDATVLDFEENDYAAIVDIKVRSRAEQVAFAKRADIEHYSELAQLSR
jgi:subtilisin family serine protease